MIKLYRVIQMIFPIMQGGIVDAVPLKVCI
jgi:hypothetical protein